MGKRCPKIFLASSEMDEARDILDILNVKYRMFSAFYLIYNWSFEKSKAIMERALNKSQLFIDSGAFTLMSAPKYKRKFEEDLPKFWDNLFDYFEKYYLFCEKYQDSLFAVADIDFDYFLDRYINPPFNILEYAPLKYKNEIEEFLLAKKEKNIEILSKYDYVMPPLNDFRKDLMSLKVPVVIIHHKDRGFSAWRHICEKYPYVGYTIKNRKIVDSHYFIEARKFGTRVHGFGLTSSDLISKYPWYSVDSSNWKYCVSYGSTMLCKNGRIKYYDNKNKAVRTQLKNYMERHGIDYDLIQEENRKELFKLGITAWEDYRKFLESENFRDKAYIYRDWNFPEQKLKNFRHTL